MNSVVKSTVWMLFAYAAIAFAIAWWMGNELRAAAHVVMSDTARLIGHEVSGALHKVSVENLVQGNNHDRKALRESLASTVRASAVLSALSVVDHNGDVVASDDGALVDSQLSRPEEVFATDREPKLFSTFSGPFDIGTHILLTPIFLEGELIGYIQMNLNNRVIGHLFEATYWRLLAFGLTGFAAIVAVGIVLHVRLSRFQYHVASMFDAALAGKRVDEISAGYEFPRIQSAAQRLGQELHAARGRAEINRQDLDTVAKVLKVGMLLLGTTGKLEFSNTAAQEMLTGGRPQDFTGQFAGIQDHLRTAIQHLRESGAPSATTDIELTIDDSARRFRMEIYTMDQRDWRRFLVIIKDRDMIDALEIDLRTATRFRGLSTLYVGAAHDLRGPLNNMVVNLELLKQTLKSSDSGNTPNSDIGRQRHCIDVIQQEIHRLNQYVHALLDLTAPTQDILSELDLTQALTEIAGLIRAQAKLQRVKLDLWMPDRPITVMCQQVQLRQVLLNIIINALEAMPSGGALNVSLRQDADYAVVEIRDTGSGIPDAIKQRIFDMHFTTKDTGTGIGLYVARSVITELGGKIELHSTLGAGTCFEVRLPVSGSERLSKNAGQQMMLPDALTEKSKWH
jgi:signal transduction histidine kinase